MMFFLMSCIPRFLRSALCSLCSALSHLITLSARTSALGGIVILLGGLMDYGCFMILSALSFLGLLMLPF